MIRTVQSGQRCEVRIASVTGEAELFYSTDGILLEAPNWTLDGSSLILNGDGKLWRFDLDAGSLEPISLTGVPDLNNDHVLAPDGQGIFVSANDGHIYRASLGGGPALRITEDHGSFHFLHGVSPDGKELAYVGIEAGDFTQPGRLMTIASDGGPTASVEVGRFDIGSGHCDGPEYSPDGKWLYVNTESFSSTQGHAQLARIRVDGTGFERLLQSETVDWFPPSLPRWPVRQLPSVPQRNHRTPRGPASRRRTCFYAGLGHAAPYMATFRWPRYPQRQQLVAGLPAFCVCGVPAF